MTALGEESPDQIKSPIYTPIIWSAYFRMNVSSGDKHTENGAWKILGVTILNGWNSN